MNELSLLEEKLNIEFKNKDFLTQAFCHRSYLNENSDFPLGHNERLEFLGDAVLELVVTDYLYETYPNDPEGVLTNWRASLVNSKMLGDVAKNLNFNDYLLLSKGEAKETGKARQFILANTFEAFVGALYLDQGYKKCNDFINRCLIPKLPEIIEKKLYRDAKSLFQERAQDKTGITPIYEVIDESGPDHNKVFIIGVFLEGELIAKGQGSSKQESEEEAAKNALIIKSW